MYLYKDLYLNVYNSSLTLHQHFFRKMVIKLETIHVSIK
jgi:hypothetical protein